MYQKSSTFHELVRFSARNFHSKLSTFLSFVATSLRLMPMECYGVSVCTIKTDLFIGS